MQFCRLALEGSLSTSRAYDLCILNIPTTTRMPTTFFSLRTSRERWLTLGNSESSSEKASSPLLYRWGQLVSAHWTQIDHRRYHSKARFCIHLYYCTEVFSHHYTIMADTLVMDFSASYNIGKVLVDNCLSLVDGYCMGKQQSNLLIYTERADPSISFKCWHSVGQFHIQNHERSWHRNRLINISRLKIEIVGGRWVSYWWINTLALFDITIYNYNRVVVYL